MVLRENRVKDEFKRFNFWLLPNSRFLLRVAKL